MAEGGSDRKLRSHSGAKQVSPMTLSPSPRQRFAGFVKEALREETKEESVYTRFARVGRSMGLEGEALAGFITKSIRDEEEMKLKKEREAEELNLLKIKREQVAEELKIKKEQEAEELRLKREKAEREAQREAEELKLKKEAAEKQEARAQREEKRREAESKLKLEQLESQDVPLDPLGDGEDVDSYIAHFERVATLCQWKKASWSTRLVALLRGKPREAVLRLHPDDLNDYAKVKTALLRFFRLDAEAYHQKFRSMRKEPDESYVQVLVRLTSCLDLWCQAAGKDPHSADDLRDLLLQEQLYRMLSPEYIVEVRRSCPQTANDVAKQATVWSEARRMGRESRRLREEDRRVHTSMRRATQGTAAAEMEPPTASQEAARGQRPNPLRQMVACYRCGQKGHLARYCPKPPSVAFVAPDHGFDSEHLTTPSLCMSCAQKPYTPRCKVTVNGLPANGIRDTGAGFTVVARNLVSPEDYTGETILISMAESNCQHRLPVAHVDICSPFVQGKIRVLVMARPVEEVLIGNFVQRSKDAAYERVPVYAVHNLAAVQTRSQAKKQNQPQSPLSLKSQILAATHDTLVNAQETDLTLRRAREACSRGTVFQVKLGTVTYEKKADVLVRRYNHPCESLTQICVPQQLRTTVLALAHDVPMSGHLGTAKTKARILPHFYWPGMCADISRYCQSCEKCQRTIDKGRVPPVPLARMPLEREPFAKVGMDIIGPITPMSQQGHRYVLVMVDYATRYPEATALKTITTEEVAEAAFNMWTRTGIPNQVLTDRGTQFTSNVMQEIFRLLSIKGLRTTPYHAQCNGLVERFNGTLKRMLRRLVQEKPEEWDRWIPALLFSYREVPQASTGFSPFELLYGRAVRGPMHVLKNLWMHPEKEELRTTVEHVVELRNKVAETCAIAQENVASAARKYKQHFDLRTRKRTFAVGSRVLVLRPQKTNKLELAWKGPYSVLERVGEVDYRIKMGPKTKIFHANLLKQFIEREPDQCQPPAIQAVVIEETEESAVATPVIGQDIPLIPLEASEGPEDVVIKAENSQFAAKLKQLVHDYGDMFTDLPSGTHLEECTIKLTDDNPVRSKPYPVPFACQQTIEDEVKTMLKMGVIEPSVSPYASPIVLVKKKDGKIRFCVDFRRLNKIVEFDSEPMPNMEHLFASLGRKNIFSKIDLAKGYWQIPVAHEDKPKTAFSTPQGHFQWRMMPFGLCTAGAVFSRMMRRLLQPLNTKDVDNFLDDILVSTETEEQHLVVLRQVFQRLKECSLSARPTKCELGCNEVAYLGHVIGHGRIWPEEEKMNRIQEISRPKTKKQVRSFLGLVGFYRRFLPGFSDIALPLTDLTKGGQPTQVRWTPECEQAFCQLKEMFVKPPVCRLPVPDQQFILRTDASGTGLGAMLFQEHEGELMPVACASKKLLPAERNYPTIEKECLALAWGVQKFSMFLYGTKFILQTDHSPLQYLERVKSTSGRVTRWALQLQPYQFIIQAIPGRDNVAADFLSRLYE